MSQRRFLFREISEDGRELLFDHGAPYFTVTNLDVLSVVTEWESRGLFRLFMIVLCFQLKGQHIYVKCCIVGQRPAPVLILMRKISCFRSGTTCYSWCYYGEGLKVLSEAPPFLKTDPIRPEFYHATIRWEANDGSGSARFVVESTGHQMSSRLLSMKSANALKLCLVIIRKETFLLNEEKV
ncbi:hypothetical protein ERO13_D05G085901v2 [Gossypium hirsutum]|uniref:Uncharacterized protein n=1 Tax=Gossypium mustelinum TaxID=34275 RepID=A0A5D2US28_GOSMU|nr:hypothetical protein ERO13_D05G085901v2 [Gossypium hirsutum]TYI80482.1 hypothetical protein E1A91_D05G090300v1 [Gossypium mustelinum]